MKNNKGLKIDPCDKFKKFLTYIHEHHIYLIVFCKLF